MSERTLLLGCDLGNRHTQLAVYDKEKWEPVLVEKTDDNPEAYLDTSISLEGEEPLVDFLDKIRRGQEIDVNGKISQPVNVLAYFFRKTLALTRKQYPGETIRQLVVSVEGANRDFVQVIYDALEQLGIGRDRAAVIDRKQSFQYYVLCQKKELWVNDVGLFDYHEGRLTYCQMKVDRSKTPILVGVQEKDYSDALEVTTSSDGHRAAVLENVVYGAIHKQLLSTLFMSGEGFAGDWAEDVFRKLCMGRRLFRGGNLYVSGACYAARELAEKQRLSDYLLLDEEMIHAHVTVPVYGDAKEQEYVLAKAGTPWYLIDEEVELIPDDDEEIPIKINNVMEQREKVLMISLEPVMAKADRRCRISMRIRFASPQSCIVTLKDKGFGDLAPSTNRIWEKTFDIA